MDPRHAEALVLLCLRCRSTRVAVSCGPRGWQPRRCPLLPGCAPANPAPVAPRFFPCVVLFLGSRPATRLGNHEDSGKNDGSATGDELHLPIRLAELKDRGATSGARAVFLGDAGSWLPFLELNHVAPVSAVQLRAIPDESVDLIVGHGDRVELGLVDRVLKVGGVAAVFAASESALQLPDNYWVVFAPRSQNEGAVAVAVEKTSASTGSAVPREHHRKLLAVPENKEDVLYGLEGVLLEPPQKR